MKIRQHPGWTYVPGSLADQPDHLLQLEDELDTAIAAVGKRRRQE